MKSTYKLIGDFWDKRPESSELARYTSFDESYLPIEMPLCLFDLAGKRRRMPLSVLFTVQNDTQLQKVAANAKDCLELAIELDCLPYLNSVIHQKFFAHRLSQVVMALSSLLPFVKIVLMLPERRNTA